MKTPIEIEAAALVVLARFNIPPDLQELLVRGNPDRGIPPGALRAAMTAQPTASVEAVARIIAREMMQSRQHDNATRAEMAARAVLASLTPAPTQGDGVRRLLERLAEIIGANRECTPEAWRDMGRECGPIFLALGMTDCGDGWGFNDDSPSPVSAPSPAGGVREALDVPIGAIENGRVFADRLEMTGLECLAGDLRMCSDWQEFRRCFEWLAEWAVSVPARMAIAKLDASLTCATDAISALGPRPCDCTRCDCGNIGDAQEVARWDERAAALSSPATPEPVSAPAGEVVERAEIKRISDWLLERNHDHLLAAQENRITMMRVRSDTEMFLDAAILLSKLAALSNPAPGHGDGG